MTNTVPTTSVAPQAARPSGRGSIRTRLLTQTILPQLVLAGLVIGNSLTFQRESDTRLLAENVLQVASNYAERVLDLEEALGLPLQEPELNTNLLLRTEKLVRTTPLPITDIAIFNRDGQMMLGYAKGMPEGSALSDPKILQTWQAQAGALATMMQQAAKTVYDDINLTQTGLTKTVQNGNKQMLLTAALIPGGEGVAVVAVDAAYVNARVQANLTRTLGLLGLTLLVSTLITAAYANRDSRRMRQLAEAVDQASKTSILENPVTIPVEGNDEITTLAEAAQRMSNSNRQLAVLAAEEA